MRLLKKHNYEQIRGYELGWSLIGSPLMTVHFYVLGNLMIDTGQPHMNKEALQIASRHNIRHVYLTHHHEDHSGNAGVIKENLCADIYGHQMTKEKMIESFKILPYQRYIWGKANPVTIVPFPETIKTILGQMIPVYTPGHSKDHTSYLLKEEGILFSGDLYLGDRTKYFRSDEDIGSQIESLKKVLSLDFQTLLCSHAPKRKDGKKHIQRKLDFLQNLYDDIITLWEKGLSEKQIFNSLKLREDYFVKLICFGNVSMMNGIRSAIQHYTSDPT
jgi:glyoxylase-like metal-dependent hydrolase (beta-lactamase superfamily II)